MTDPNLDNKDFEEFTNAHGTRPPEHLNNTILGLVQADLNPGHKIVFAKLLGIQAFIGFLTMTFCPQFSLSLTNNYDLFHYFHHTYGENACMAICGCIFIGSGAVFATYILKSSEVRKIKQSRFLYYFAITSIALSLFILLGADIYIKLTSFWFLGATLGGLFMFELNSLIRSKVLQY